MAQPDDNKPERGVSDHTTTTTTTTSGGSSSMAFIVGALVVIVAVLGYFMFVGGSVDGNGDVNITVEGAGDAVEGAVESATPTE